MARRPRCLSGAAFVLESPCPISPTLRNILPLLLLVQNLRFLSPEASSNSNAARPSSPSLLEFLLVGICSFPLLHTDLAPYSLTKGVLGSTVSSSQGKESLQPPLLPTHKVSSCHQRPQSFSPYTVSVSGKILTASSIPNWEKQFPSQRTINHPGALTSCKCQGPGPTGLHAHLCVVDGNR